MHQRETTHSSSTPYANRSKGMGRELLPIIPVPLFVADAELCCWTV
uniref:Uncharacterized protein n=1 Tax=Arundo donax TaxID=35708 RepID=A0A0A9DWE1_ARUDO